MLLQLPRLHFRSITINKPQDESQKVARHELLFYSYQWAIYSSLLSVKCQDFQVLQVFIHNKNQSCLCLDCYKPRLPLLL